MFQNGGDGTAFLKQCHNAGSSILKALKTGNVVVRKTVEKSIAIVKARSNKCMNNLQCMNNKPLLSASFCLSVLSN